MPGRRTILPSAIFTLVLIAALASQATGTTRAAEDCLTKPNGPAPEGQHWYYRMDHARHRQCWRLAEEGLSVRKSAPQSQEAEEAEETEPAPELAPVRRARPPQPAAAAPAPAPTPAQAPPPASTNAAPAAANSVAATPVVPWPDVSKLLPPSPVVPQAQAVPQTASADDTVPATASIDTPATADDSPAADSVPAETSQRPAPAKASEASPQLPGIERSFILLIVMFGLLAVTGPIIHFTHKQRQREVINYKPPRWAPLPLDDDAGAARARQHAPDPTLANPPTRRVARQIDKPAWRPAPDLIPTPAPQRPERAAPVPASLPDLNEELRYALQQLVDRIHTLKPGQPDDAPPADVRMLKKAR